MPLFLQPSSSLRERENISKQRSIVKISYQLISAQLLWLVCYANRQRQSPFAVSNVI